MAQETDSQLVVVSPKVAALAKAQQIRPPNFDLIMSGEPVLPEDETADMMIDAIYRSRRDEDPGSDA